jgi:ABC-2 type transport system permease protein
MALRRQLAYRAANLGGFATNLFFGALRAYVIIALFGARPSVAGYDLQAAVTFTGLTQALLSFVAILGWWDLMRTIRTGEVATDLARPADFFWYWAAQDLGRALGQLIWRGLPVMVVYALVFRIALPPTPLHALLLVPALALALFISFAWRFLVSLAAFWTRDAVGVGRFAWTLSMFCAGFVMPLAFFPDWAQRLMRLTPFPYMLTTPVEIYLGLRSGTALFGELALQALWCLVLYAVVRLVLSAGVRKVVIEGG